MIGTGSRTSTRYLLALSLAAALGAGGCATSSNLVNLWKDPEVAAHPLRSVVVVSMAQRPAVRRLWEDGFVAELAKHGTQATPSYRLWPDAAPDTMDLMQAVTQQRFDGVISIHRLPTETATHYVPGYVTATPYGHVNPWTGYYHQHYVEEFQPGYTETDQIVRYEVDVWCPADEGLVWSGTTETVNPSSTTDVNREVSHLIVPELGESGVIAKSRT